MSKSTGKRAYRSHPTLKGVALGNTVQTVKIWMHKARSLDVNLDQLYRDIERGVEYFWDKRGGRPRGSEFS